MAFWEMSYTVVMPMHRISRRNASGASTYDGRMSPVRTPARRGRYDLSRSDLGALLEGEPRYRADQVWKGLYRRGADPAEMLELPRVLRARLEEGLPPGLVLAAQQEADAGSTVKWLWSLADGSRVETVLMRYPDR